MDLLPARGAAVSDTQRARVLGVFYLFGGVVGAVTLLVGAWPGADVGRLGVITTMTGVTGAVMVRYPQIVPRWACHAIVGSGSVVIALCVYLGGGGAASASYQLYFVWTGLYVFIFYGGAVRIAHTAFSGVCLLVTLVLLGETGHAAAALVITIGTCLGAGVIVGHLMSQVRALAETDPLTGVLNRRAAEQLLADALARARRSGQPLSIALLDLDGFKQLNDLAGHAAGDRALCEATTRWETQLRDVDTLARLGGDEFLVVLEGCPEEFARSTAERLIDVTPDEVGCSAGLARWDGTETSSELLLRGDAALYRAKAEGGSTIVVAAVRSPMPTGTTERSD